MNEVVAGETARTKFSSVNTGGPWYSGVRNQCRPKVYTHAEGFYYYFLGFRCCSNPDGEDNEPRTPKQLHKKWDFSRVERLARFDVAEMKDKLALKATGECSCKSRATSCARPCVAPFSVTTRWTAVIKHVCRTAPVRRSSSSASETLFGV